MSMMNCLCALFSIHGVISKAGEFMMVGWFVRDFCIHVFNFMGYHLKDGWEWTICLEGRSLGKSTLYIPKY